MLPEPFTRSNHRLGRRLSIRGVLALRIVEKACPAPSYISISYFFLYLSRVSRNIVDFRLRRARIVSAVMAQEGRAYTF